MNTDSPKMDTADIAAYLGVTRAHVTDRIVKRVDFPVPHINRSRKLKRWRADDVVAWASGQSLAPMSSADTR